MHGLPIVPAPPPSRADPASVGHGLPVRCKCLWEESQISQLDQREQISMPGDPSGAALQARDVVAVLE
jgi:hypothetical protein